MRAVVPQYDLAAPAPIGRRGSSGNGAGVTNRDFHKWAADALVRQLRDGVRPSIEAAAFVWEPMLSDLRSTVTPDDRDLVVRLLGDPDLVMFGGLLSRALPDDDEITGLVLAAFRGEADEERKIGLFHQAAARPIGPEERRELVDWLDEHATVFIDEQREFFGGPDGPERIHGRLTLPEFAAKRWVYMYAAHALGDSDVARALVATYVDDPDPITAAAAQRSLARFDA